MVNIKNIKRNILIYLFVFFSVATPFHIAFAENDDIPVVDGLEIPYMVYDRAAGESIVKNMENEKIAIASITKLMTAYLTYEAIKNNEIAMDTKYTYTQEELDLYLRGSDVPIERGATLDVNELLHLLLIRSANSSALALSKVISGSETAFVEKMNKKAAELNMNDTHFINCHGLPIIQTDEQNMSTLVDLNILVNKLLDDFPEILEITKLKEYTIERLNLKTVSTNPLLGTGSIDGLKTGTTTKAGRCLIATATEDMSGLDGKRRVISYVFGAANEKERGIVSLGLLNYALDEYVYKRVVTGKERYSLDLDGINFQKDKIGLMPKTACDKLLDVNSTYKLRIEYLEPGKETIPEGEVLGSITLVKDGEPIEKIDLLTVEEVKRSGFFKRLWKKIKSKF